MLQLDQEYPETDFGYLPAVKAPKITDGCVRTAQFIMYLGQLGGTDVSSSVAAITLTTLLAINFNHINDTMEASHRIVSSLDERKDSYLSKFDTALSRADGVFNQAILLLTEQVLPMLSNSSTDAKETLDRFLAVLKSYSQKGRLTVEVPL